MGSSGTLSAGINLPASSHTLVAFSVCASNLYPRPLNLSPSRSISCLQAHHSVSITTIQGEVGFSKAPTIEEESEEESTDAAAEAWEDELLDELDPLLYLQNGKRKKSRRQKSPSTDTSIDGVDWVQHARERALRALEAQNPKAANYLKSRIEPKPDGKTQKRNKKKKLKKKLLLLENPGIRNTQSRLSVKKLEKKLKQKSDGPLATANNVYTRKLKDIAHLDGFVDSGDNVDLDDIDNIEDLPMDSNSEFASWQAHRRHRPLTVSSVGFAASESPNSNEQVSEREKAFNRRLVEAQNALEILENVHAAEERTRALGVPSLLTSLNTATALHRIARHMEAMGTSKSDRLAFARKRQMAELVGRSMEILPKCSAQGLSNIAWAYSKIGGSTLYFSEMDRIADAVLMKVSEFNSQNVANTLGAYASMQHGMPSLFASLCNHALDILESFNSQELAQLLWAHAELMQQADPLLDALDSVCLLLKKGCADQPDTSGSNTFNPFGNASVDHLANLAWSYAVLNQLHRPSFNYLWQVLESVLEADSTNALSAWHLSQIFQVNLCLQYEYPHNGSQTGSTSKILLKDAATEAWQDYKASTWSTSEYQDDVKWHLVSMGQNWVAEYVAAGYSLDLALPEEKVAIEIDGPSHFVRNTGSPLGHTVLKKRLLSSAGWRLLSISYDKWEELDGETEQRNFLKELLESVA